LYTWYIELGTTKQPNREAIDMPTHKIEIDEEVFSYLQSKAEPFVDSPNMVLRRELLGINGSSAPSSAQQIPQLPPGTPKALEEILQVVYFVRAEGYSRSEATRTVAHHHQVAKQTVIDKYTRQLGITASEFDGLLAVADPSELRAYLYTKFMEYESLIKKYL
jgi:hypothetical protein